MKKINIFFLIACLVSGLFSCTDYDDYTSKHAYPDQNVYGTKTVYIPNDLKDVNLDDEESQWCYERSRQSENWIVFWEKGFLSDPTYVMPKFSVNINDLLGKAEEYYTKYKTDLKMLTSSSKSDQYKMMIFLNYSLEEKTEGYGYDDAIGALWINIPAGQPIDRELAKEAAKCFLYQIFCDDATQNAGFRYGFGISDKTTNVFWEQTAQWLSFKYLPNQQFSNSLFSDYLNYAHLNLMHEKTRFSNYFIHDFFESKNGAGFIGKIWQQAKEPQDIVEAYKSITSIDQNEFNNEFFDYARHTVGWDLDALRDAGANYLTRTQCAMTKTSDGSWAVNADVCPENYGYNVINLNVVDSATVVKANFKGIAGADGYRAVKTDKAGWRYGFVALLNDGASVYSDIFSDAEGSATFTCPGKMKKLCFVVSGAPTEHWAHPWDDDLTNDEQWPYQVNFAGTNLFGEISIDPNADPKDITLTYDVAMVKNNDYAPTPVQIDYGRLATAFSLLPEQIIDIFDKKIIFNGINSDGTMSSTSTAGHPGHWFDAAGNICNWGETARLYSEFAVDKFTFNIGPYPNVGAVGDKYTIKQALVYTNDAGKKATATIVFNITLQ